MPQSKHKTYATCSASFPCCMPPTFHFTSQHLTWLPAYLYQKDDKALPVCPDSSKRFWLLCNIVNQPYGHVVADACCRRDPISIFDKSNEVCGKVAVRQVSLPVLCFSPVAIIPRTLHSHHHLNIASSRTNPDGVNGIFHLHNPSARTVALRSTQPLTEMSTRNISLRG